MFNLNLAENPVTFSSKDHQGQRQTDFGDPWAIELNQWN